MAGVTGETITTMVVNGLVKRDAGAHLAYGPRTLRAPAAAAGLVTLGADRPDHRSQQVFPLMEVERPLSSERRDGRESLLWSKPRVVRSRRVIWPRESAFTISARLPRALCALVCRMRDAFSEIYISSLHCRAQYFAIAATPRYGQRLSIILP